MDINTYKNIYDVSSQSKINIYDWFEMIKNPNNELKNLILKARSFGKENQNYQIIKTHEIPCVTYNFLFKGRKCNDNIESSSGLMYIDIDDTSFDVDQLDKSKIFAYYKSFGGNGYSILVQVVNLSLDNFNSTFMEICKDLDIVKYVDLGAKKATQYSIMSWDENIFINASSYVFNVDKFWFTSSVYSNRVNINILNKDNKHIYDEVNQNEVDMKSLRMDNIDVIYSNVNDEIVITNFEGFEYFSAWKPYLNNKIGKIKLNRNNILLSFCNNLVVLNPTQPKQRIFDAISTFNSIVFENPVNDYHLNKVLNSIYKYKEDGSLRPLMPKAKRKILINPNAKLTSDEKNKLIREVLAKKKTDDIVNKLSDIICNWDRDNFGSISMQKISDNFKISKRTVNKYWKMFSEEIKLKK